MRSRGIPPSGKELLLPILLLSILLISTACSSTLQTPVQTTPAPSPVLKPVTSTRAGMTHLPSPIRRPWNAIQNWVYWLDNPDLQQLSSSNTELIVMDYSADGSASKAFTAQQITALHTTGCQRRVVAYLSIGQAESYRGYWQRNWHIGNPSWLKTQDPSWQSNYWIDYWNPAWQRIIYHYIDTIIAAGFDGIYLDRIDAYQEDYAAGHEEDMVRFVESIINYTHAHSPLQSDFGIIAQNAEELAERHTDYVSMLTGIAREEVYVQALNHPTSATQRASVEHDLDIFKQKSQGNLVLTVDYANKKALIQEAYTRSRARGYIPYVTNVALDHIQFNSGDEPACSPLS